MRCLCVRMFDLNMAIKWEEIYLCRIGNAPFIEKNMFLCENYEKDEKKRRIMGSNDRFLPFYLKLRHFIWVILVNIWQRKCWCIYLASDKIICVPVFMVSAFSTSHRSHFPTKPNFFPHFSSNLPTFSLHRIYWSLRVSYSIGKELHFTVITILKKRLLCLPFFGQSQFHWIWLDHSRNINTPLALMNRTPFE